MVRPRMCAARDETARYLAVLGVLSTQASRFRDVARETWLADLSSGSRVLTRFVLRGSGASASAIIEQKTHGDVVFVDAPASMGRATGPLRSLILWWECAVYAWPKVQMIGKADEVPIPRGCTG